MTDSALRVLRSWYCLVVECCSRGLRLGLRSGACGREPAVGGLRLGRLPKRVDTRSAMEQEAVRLSLPASFTTTGQRAKEASQRPWSQSGGEAGGARSHGQRRHRQQLEALTAGRTEVLQAYLSDQLTRLSGATRETFEASILGATGSPAQSPAPADASPARRKRRSPSRRRASGKPILYPERSVPTGVGPVASPSPRAAEDPNRSRHGVIVPHDTGASDYSAGATVAPSPVIDRWPAHSSAPRPDDLGALRAPLSPPQPLVVDDGVLFEDRSRQAHSPSRARARSSDHRDAADPASRSSGSISVSPARSAMAGQLLRTAPKLLQDLEYYLNRELEENDVAGAERVGHPVRARIIGECFDCFIEHCSTYKPLLAKIKSEYEETITLLREQVDSAKPNLNRLATLTHMTATEKVEQRVAHYRDTKSLRAENEEMKARTWRLEKTVAELREEMEQKKKRMEKYAEDAETDFNQNQALSAALQAAKQQNAASAGLWLEKESLAQALDVAEKQLDQLSIRLDGAVPSDVHNAILLARDQLEEKHKKVAHSEARLTTQVKTLQATNERLNQKIESLNSQVSLMETQTE